MDKYAWNTERPAQEQWKEIYDAISGGKRLVLTGYPKTSNALYASIRRTYNFCVRIAHIPGTSDLVVH